MYKDFVYSDPYSNLNVIYWLNIYPFVRILNCNVTGSNYGDKFLNNFQHYSIMNSETKIKLLLLLSAVVTGAYGYIILIMYSTTTI